MRHSTAIRWTPAALVVAAAAGMLLASTPTPAFAHALLRTSDPASGAVLGTAPVQVLITFTEAPDPQLSSIQVLDSSGATASKQPAQAVPGDPLQLRLPLPALPQGSYTVVWRTVSKVDGHVTGGSFAFGVGVAPVSTGGGGGGARVASTPIRPAAAAGRWALDWGLILLLGAGVAGTFVTRRFAAGHRPLLVGAWVLAAGGLMLQALAERSAVGVSLGTLLRSAAGQDLVTLGFTLLAPLVMIGVALLRPRWESMLFLAIAAAAVLFVVAISGHAAGESPEWLHVGVEWLHLLAVGVWVGGLAWLLLSIRGRSNDPTDAGDPTEADEERRAAVRRFSTMAGVALAVTVATGIGRAWAELDGWRPLFETAFGVTLLIKSALVAVLIAFGALNRYRYIPAIERPNPGVRKVRRTVRFEVIVAVAVVAVTAVLSELPPGAYIAAAKARSGPPTFFTVSGSDFGTSVRVKLTIAPGTVGPNGFVAHLDDYDSGAPVVARSVSLQFSLPSRPDVGASTLPLKRAARGVWGGQGSQLSIVGTWDVTVLIQEETGAVEVPLKVRTRLPPEQISVARVPGQPTLYTIAVPGGGSLQTYVDPGRIGLNQVHFTFFTASGSEQPIRSATATATDPSKRERPLPLIRFDRGHFVANTALIDGRWMFSIDAVTTDGRSISGYFSQTIGGS